MIRIVYYTTHNIHKKCTLYSVQCEIHMCSSHFTYIQYLHCMLYMIYLVHGISSSVYWTMYNTYCILYIVQCSSNTLQCTLYSVKCTWYNSHVLEDISCTLFMQDLLLWRQSVSIFYIHVFIIQYNQCTLTHVYSMRIHFTDSLLINIIIIVNNFSCIKYHLYYLSIRLVHN